VVGFKDRKRRLGAALEAEALVAKVENTNTAHFEFGMVKTATSGTSLKLMAIRLVSVHFEVAKGKTSRVFS
jgi:hypothetical protein